MKTRLPKGCALALSLALGAAALCRAERLPRADWVVKDADGQVLSRATDNDLATAAVIEGSALSPLAFTIDLGRPCVIHRFYLTGGPAAKAPPAKPAEGPGLLEAPPLPRAPYPARLTLFAGDAPDRMAVVATAPIPTNTGTDVRFEADVRFPPVAARCLRVVAADKAEGLRWSIAEMEILGSTRQEAFAPPDAVVVATNAPFPLQLGAQDMSYYLGEMTGVPLPIVAPAESDKYPGTLYCVETPAPLPPYEDLVKQPLPDFERVDVRRDGRKVVFGGVIPRTVLFGVYAFLDAQGVRWLAPESLGDFVPARPKVDLAVLPLDFAPSIKTRHFSGNSQAFFSRTSETYLWLWRNRWNMTWGWEYNEIIGALPWPRKSPSFGHPHSLTELVPAGLYTNHPDWFPYYREDSPYRDRISGKRAWHPHPLGQRVPYDTTWGLNPCLSNTGVVNYVAEQIVSNTIPRDAYALCTVSPLDAGVWCECDACRALDVDLTPEWLIRWGDRIISDRYFGFVAKVARQIAPAVPHVQILALAYNDYHKPPTSIAKLPDNVLVDVLQYFDPTTSPFADTKRNKEMRSRMETWRRKAAHLGIYDHSLLLNTSKAPIPMIATFADRFRLYRALNVEYAECEAVFKKDLVRFNPWNYYAYSRFLYYPDLTAAQVTREFFDGYYGPAGPAMQAYYQTLERYLYTNNVALTDGAATRGGFPVHVLLPMRQHLAEAARAAKDWVTAQRVATAREGLDYVLAEVGVRENELENPALFPSVPADGTPYHVALTNLSLYRQYAAPRKNGELGFVAQGVAGTQLRFEAPGAYLATVTARSVPYESEWPQMFLSIGTTQAAPVAAASTNEASYSMRMAVPAGVWQLVLAFPNGAPGGRRNLFVSDISIAKEK